jgi:hypothetical protein
MENVEKQREIPKKFSIFEFKCLKTIEERFNGINMLVAELDLTWKVKINVLMVDEEVGTV